MNRLNPLANHLANGFVACAVALGLVGCSDGSNNGGGYGGPAQTPGQTTVGNTPSTGNPSPGGGTNMNKSGNSATGSSSGSGGGMTGTSPGGMTGTPGGGSSGGPASGSGSGGSSSGSMGTPPSGGTDAGGSTSADSGQATRYGSTAGCGQGTSCTPGNDLPVPAASDGFQVATPDGSITVMPGEEQFLCYYRNMPNTSTVDVGTFQSWMTPGSSHHFIAYQQGGSGAFGGSLQSDGTLVSCGFGGGTWVYATSLPGTIVEMKMPDGVGLPFDAGSQIMLNMHFINPGSSPVSPVVKMNMLYVSNIQYTAASMTSFNSQIDVPAATATGPGTQTVNGTCTAPVGSNFFIVTSHTHKHATLAQVNYVTGGQTINLVNTTDWEHPDARIWTAPNFLTVQQGDSFSYSCTYSNDSSSPVTVGETAASNEMCMAISYYFPAASTICN